MNLEWQCKKIFSLERPPAVSTPSASIQKIFVCTVGEPLQKFQTTGNGYSYIKNLQGKYRDRWIKKAILSFFPSLHRFTTLSYPFTILTSYLVFLLPSLKSQSHFYFPVSLFYFLFPSITPYLYKTPRSGGRIGSLPCKFFQPYRRIQWRSHCYRRDPLSLPKSHHPSP